MKVHVDIQSASTEPAPEEDDIRRWISAALHQASASTGPAEVCLRIVDEAEMAQLNHSYRGKAGPTNVLSFPADLPPELQLPLLGDIVICAPVVLREAREQGKSASAHWAHMLVHGSLHLLGHDHIEAAEAAVMETLETRILGELGFPCPYSDHLHEELLPQ